MTMYSYRHRGLLIVQEPLVEVPADPTVAAQVREVFDYWIEVMGKGKRGVKPVLSDKRRRLISKAVKIYGTDVCKRAIDGCATSDFHMGQNSRGKKYNDVELIFRNEAKVEQFVEMADDAIDDFVASDEPLPF